MITGFRAVKVIAKTVPGRSVLLDPTPCKVSWNDGTQVLVYGGVSDYCLQIGEGHARVLFCPLSPDAGLRSLLESTCCTVAQKSFS